MLCVFKEKITWVYSVFINILVYVMSYRTLREALELRGAYKTKRQMCDVELVSRRMLFGA